MHFPRKKEGQMDEENSVPGLGTYQGAKFGGITLQR